MIPMPKVVVTGTGRCGTGYVSKLLEALDVPAGHEAIYKPGCDGSWEISELEVECSWLALPFLKRSPHTVIHLVREPLKCIRSLAANEYNPNHQTAFQDFRYEHLPRALEWDTPFERAAECWVQWNKKIEKLLPLARVKLEDMPAKVDVIVAHTGRPRPTPERIEKASRLVPKNYNSMPKTHNGYELEELPKPLYKKVLSLAGEYGYQV